MPFLFIVVLEFVLTLAITNIGGEIFRTTPLPTAMFWTSIVAGLGSLLVGVILKATPERWVEKIKMTLDEEGIPDEKGVFARFQRWIMGGVKNENERLLD